MTNDIDDIFADLDNDLDNGLNTPAAKTKTTSTPRTARDLARRGKGKGKTKDKDNAADTSADSTALSPTFAALVEDHAAVSKEIDDAQRQAFDSIDGSVYVHSAGTGAMPMDDVTRVLSLAGVPAAALRGWTPDYLTAIAQRHRAVVEGSGGTLTPVSVVTDVDLVDTGIEITVAPATATAAAIAPATARAAVASAFAEATGGVRWTAAVEGGGAVRLTSQVKFDARAAASRSLVRAASPRMAGLVGAGGRERWKTIARKAGLVEETTRKEKVYDHTQNKHVELPRRKITSSWPVKFVLGDGERGGIAFSTPPEVTLDRWRKALPILETMLGVADLDVARSAPGEVTLWLPRETRAMTAFVPGPDELTHIAAASTEAEARAAAVAAHGVFRWVLGRTSEGEILGERISRAPHALVAGGTGAGKSTWVTWLASTLVAAGADVILADGKGSSDYDGIARELPNVKCLSKSPVEHVAALQWLADEMEHRYVVESARGRAGVARDAQLYHRPAVLIFDEYGAFKEQLGSDSGPLGNDLPEIDSLVTRILQKGRAARCHVVFVSQSIYAETLPGKQKNNVPVRLSLGVPAPYTLREVVGSDQLFDEAKAIAATIPRGRPGQGIAVAESEVDGEPHAQRVAVPYGYVPGAPGRREPAVQEVWDKTKTQVFDNLKSLTPRMALAFDAPVEVAERGKKIPAPTSWQEYGLHEIRQLPWVRVTAWRGTPPPPGAERYDIFSDAYAGSESTSTAARYH